MSTKVFAKSRFNSIDPPRTGVPNLHPTHLRRNSANSQRACSSRLAAILAFLFALCLCAGAPANAQDYSHIRIVRLSFIEGNVQYQRPGQDWQDARLNLPIEQGYALRTDDGYAEVEFESGLEMRLAQNSSVEFTELSLVNGGHVTRLRVAAGTASVDAKLSKADRLSLAASNFRVNVPRDARFRIDTSAAESWVSVFHGKVAVLSGSDSAPDSASNSAAINVSGRHAVHESADDLASLQIQKDPPRDAFDKWVAQRDDGISDARADMSDALRGSSYTTGFADLDLYGGWADVPGYGWGWQPYGVASGWVPFYSGQWMFMGNTGWNWVSAEPWGWLPYHFGGWVNAGGTGLDVGAARRTWLAARHGHLGSNGQSSGMDARSGLASKAAQIRERSAGFACSHADRGRRREWRDDCPCSRGADYLGESYRGSHCGSRRPRQRACERGRE